MIGRFIYWLASIFWQLLVGVLYWALGLLISGAIRLTPLFFRLSVALTAWTLALMDIRLEGRLVSRAGATYLAAGVLWGLAGLIAPIFLSLLLGLRPGFFTLFLAAGGFGYGLVCAFRVRRLPGWGAWLANDGLPLGEGQ